ncbi:MAG: response regulator [Vicinamibacterales bacterium]
MTDTTRRPLVLLVEDYADTRDMYREFLEMSGFDVATAADGLEGVALATELQPDLVLMDLSLPLLDGWEAIRRLRAAPATARLRIIAHSAMPRAGGGRAGRELECDAFIAKPCLPDELVRQLVSCLALDQTVSARRSTKGPLA